MIYTIGGACLFRSQSEFVLFRFLLIFWDTIWWVFLLMGIMIDVKSKNFRHNFTKNRWEANKPAPPLLSYYLQNFKNSKKYMIHKKNKLITK